MMCSKQSVPLNSDDTEDRSLAIYLFRRPPDDQDLEPGDVNGIGTIMLEVCKAKVIFLIKANYGELIIPFNEIHKSQKKGGIHRESLCKVMSSIVPFEFKYRPMDISETLGTQCICNTELSFLQISSIFLILWWLFIKAQAKQLFKRS
jgi:hypothetical protein